VHLDGGTLDWSVSVAAKLEQIKAVHGSVAPPYLFQQASDLNAWLVAPSLAFAQRNCHSAFGDTAAFADVPMAALEMVICMANSETRPNLDSAKGAARTQGQWIFAVLWSFHSAMSPHVRPLSAAALTDLWTVTLMPAPANER
jgi:hypothetical protein